MASQSLYRKWRSQTFNELVGQEAVVRTLKNALTGNTLAHAYLFTGPRGTGKTSMARLLAKTINCTNPHDGEPCNECEQCREITAGSSFNVIEIDAASNRGIDSIRDLREKVMMPPATGKYKVYILDEAHMLTTEAFNALLKTLEEPPPHAIFVMATTDVHKMLPTVLSRCQRFDFKRFSVRQIVDHLHFVAQQEQITLEGGAAELLARAAAGGMRDALSLLDQAIAYSGQQIALAQVQAMLGVADPRAIQKFIAHVANLDRRTGLHLIHELSEAGADLRQINTQIMDYWRSMMLAKNGADIGAILDVTGEEIKEIKEMTQYFSLEELPECARIFAQNDLIQKNMGTPQLGLELAFLACLDLHQRAQSGQTVAPAASVVAVAPVARPTVVQPRPSPAQGNFQRLSSHVPEPRVPAPAPAEQHVPAPPPVETRPAPQPSTPAAQPEEEAPLPDWDDVAWQDVDEPVDAAPATSPTPPAAPVAAEPPAAPVRDAAPEAQDAQEAQTSEADEDAPTITVQDIKEKWEYIKRRVRTKKDGPVVAALLNDYTVVTIEGTRTLPIVLIRAKSDFHFNAIHKSEARHNIVEWAMKIELGQECRVRLLPPGYGGPAAVLPPPSPDSPFTVPSNNNRATRATRSAPAARPAYRERPATPPPSQNGHAPVQRAEPAAAASPVQSTRSAPTAPAASSKQYTEVVEPEKPAYEQQSPPPLARKGVVRENTSIASPATMEKSGETRQRSVEKKAKGDPVVQEVMRMFKAELKEIKLQ